MDELSNITEVKEVTKSYNFSYMRYAKYLKRGGKKLIDGY